MLRRSASGALLMVLACVRSAATLLLRLVPLTALTALDLRPAGKSYRKTQWLPYDVLAGEAGPPLCIRGIVSLLPARLPGCVAAAFLSACVYSLSPSAAVLPLPLLPHSPLPHPISPASFPCCSSPAADGRQQLVRNFQKKKAAGEVDPYGDLTDGIHPHWLEVCGWGGLGWAAGAACAASSWLYAWVCYLSCLLLNSSPLLASCHRDPASSVDCAPPFGAFCACPQVDRVIAHRTRLGRRSFLVKWRGLGYAESTWESERDLQGEEVGV